jgi:hypothetical protein
MDKARDVQELRWLCQIHPARNQIVEIGAAR